MPDPNSPSPESIAVASALVESSRPLPGRVLVLDDDDGAVAAAFVTAGVAVVSVVADSGVARSLGERFGASVEVRSGDPLASWGVLRQGELFEPVETAGDLFEGAPFPLVVVDAKSSPIEPEERARLRLEFRTARHPYGRDVLLIERASQLAGLSGRAVFACRPELFSRQAGVALSEDVLAERGPHLVIDARQARPGRVIVAEQTGESNESIRPRSGVPAEGRWAVLLEGIRDPSHPWIDRREIPAGLSDPADALDSGRARTLLDAVRKGSDGVAADILAVRPGRTTACGFRDVWLDDPGDRTRPILRAEDLRDWSVAPSQHVLWPYERPGRPVERVEGEIAARLALHRPLLESRRIFGETIERRGIRWWEHSEHYPSRIEAPHRVAIATRGTHNHAALLADSEVLASSSAMILPAVDSESAHLLLGLLNSSLICFWFKHTAARRQRFELTISQILELPLPARYRETIVAIARKLDRLARQQVELGALVEQTEVGQLGERLDGERRHRQRLRGEMIWWQEELDWAVYAAYGLVRRTDSDTLPRAIAPHERSFLTARSHPGRAAIVEHDSVISAVERGNYKRPFDRDDFDSDSHAAIDAELRRRATSLVREGEAQPLPDFQAAILADPAMRALSSLLGRSCEEWLEEFLARVMPLNPFEVYTASGWAKRLATLDAAKDSVRREAGDHGGASDVQVFERRDFRSAENWLSRGRHDVDHSSLRRANDLESLEGRSWVVRMPRTPTMWARLEDTLRDLYFRRTFYLPSDVDDDAYGALYLVFEEVRRLGTVYRAYTTIEGEPLKGVFAEATPKSGWEAAERWYAGGRQHPADDGVGQLDLDRIARMRSLMNDLGPCSARQAFEALAAEGWRAFDVRRTLDSLVQSGVCRKDDETYRGVK